MKIDDLITDVNSLATEINTKVISSNIKSGVNIFGVNGTIIIPQIEENIEDVVPTTSDQTIIPSSGYAGIEKIKVLAVDRAIDSNISANNIRYDKTILGVQGNLSALSQTDYLNALYLQGQILGYDIYVIGDKLIINSAEITDDKMTVDGTVSGDKLVIN